MTALSLPTSLTRTLRKRQTPSEGARWQHLRAHRLVGTKWKRQQPIGPYIVDFVCHECRIVVEADGGQHNGSQSDAERDRWLAAKGFTVLRFWNNEIQQNLDGVLERILAGVTLSPTPLPSRERDSIASLPRAGEGPRLAWRDVANPQIASLPPGGGGTEGEGR